MGTTDRRTDSHLPGLTIAGLAALGAGAVHAAAIGVHAEHPTLARLFVAVAALQLATGLHALIRPSRWGAITLAAVNAGAVVAWVVTRVAGISWIDGLGQREAAQFTDTACAVLGAAAAGLALGAALLGRRNGPPHRLAIPLVAVAALALPAMWSGSTHQHAHGSVALGANGATGEALPHNHDSGTGTTGTGTTDPSGTVDPTATTVHSHGGSTATTDWPRPWDPAQPLDVSGVAGVTPEQEARATTLVQDTLRVLPKWSTTAAAEADGFVSIGDAGTGSEHFLKYQYINDNHFLDPSYPESLVYTVNGSQRTLAGAMFIASARPTDDPTLTDWAGPLMTWHNHGNLCWAIVKGKPTVVGITDASGTCTKGVNTGGENPMVHVWITPNQCGVFAALEGVGAGQASVPDAQRHDMCQHSHGTGTGTAAAATPKPYDPSLPIDLSGMPGVTAQQQAAAENLVAETVVRLPKLWTDYHAAEAAGFHSIGDSLTGFEHFINWDWINDDVALDPDHPESLVYQPQPDGSKKLVSAMFMLPDTVPLEKVPNIGGALMQWHIHDNLCFTNDPVAPHVAGITNATGGCPSGLQKFRPAPMIHVWIVPHTCGPFAALEGVGAGQIAAGTERLCDHVHGASTGL